MVVIARRESAVANSDRLLRYARNDGHCQLIYVVYYNS